MSAKRTSLYDQHVALKGKIVDFAGWDMPVQYSSVKEEVQAVRQKVGVFDVSHMGEFFLEGADAVACIDHLVTNDIHNAPIGKAIYSPLCRENGTVIDDLIVYKLAADRVLICVNASNIDKDFDWMKNHLGQFRAKLSNRSDEYSLLALQGPLSADELRKHISDLPDMEYYSVWEGKMNGNLVIVARTGYTGEDGFEIFAAHDAIKQLWSSLLANGVTPCGLASRDVLRLEVCYPLYGHELTDETTPYDAGLGWTVKGDKPEFIGKAALATKPSRFKLVKLLVEKGIPREGYPVCNAQGEVIGVITSGTSSVVLAQGVALARIHKDKATSEQNYFVDIRNKQYPAKLTSKPFVQGGHK